MAKEKLFIASDHAGFELKQVINEFLISEGHAVEDLGPHEYDSTDDYPDYAVKVCEKVLETEGRGILICASGQGMDRVANKIPGIYAAVCWSELTTRIAKEHGNTNVLCLGAKTITPGLAETIVKLWLELPFTGEERHVRRIKKIKAVEERYAKDRTPSTNQVS